MSRAMHRFVIPAALAVVAAASAGCSSEGAGRDSSSSVLAPSSLGDPASPTLGKGRPGGSGSGSGTLTLVMYTDNNANGAPNWNDTVTFNVSTTATSVPYVNLGCYQNGALVASASAGFFASYPFSWAQLMTLSSRTWTGGAADCKADLGYYNNKGSFVVLTSLNFHVDQ